ncbi:MAG: hypothetical protein PUC12_16345 [Clostridiales bacterium]|nr:hypothetical protein [Clostridiales bacterium]
MWNGEAMSEFGFGQRKEMGAVGCRQMKEEFGKKKVVLETIAAVNCSPLNI